IRDGCPARSDRSRASPAVDGPCRAYARARLPAGSRRRCVTTRRPLLTVSRSLRTSEQGAREAGRTGARAARGPEDPDQANARLPPSTGTVAVALLWAEIVVVRMRWDRPQPHLRSQ